MARAGLFRDACQFQRMSSTVDAYGNTTGDFSNLVRRSGYLVERMGKEATEGGALKDVSIASLTVRADDVIKSITVADRVIARGITWAIKSILQPTSKGDVLELTLEKGVAA